MSKPAHQRIALVAYEASQDIARALAAERRNIETPSHLLGLRQTQPLEFFASRLDALSEEAWENDAAAVKTLCELLGLTELAKRYEEEQTPGVEMEQR